MGPSEGFKLLATSYLCRNQMMVKRSDGHWLYNGVRAAGLETEPATALYMSYLYDRNVQFTLQGKVYEISAAIP